jgi:anti-sigma regulatory factor (Ser/Thr protein kinase)
MGGLPEATSHLIIGNIDLEPAQVYEWLESVTAGLPKKLLYGMHVALEEAVMNVAMHAFPAEERGEIRIGLIELADRVELVVEDNGTEFDPTRFSASPAAPGLQTGGRGLTLMRHYCPDIRYRRAGGWNRLRLCFPRLSAE